MRYRSDIIKTEVNIKMNNSFIQQKFIKILFVVWLILNMTDKLKNKNPSQYVPKKQNYSLQTVTCSSLQKKCF